MVEIYITNEKDNTITYAKNKEGKTKYIIGSQKNIMTLMGAARIEVAREMEPSDIISTMLDLREGFRKLKFEDMDEIK